MNDQIKSITTLEFGTPVEGGFFAGYINTPDGRYGIAVAPKAHGEMKGIWIARNKKVPGAISYNDCRANTLAMAEAGSKLAQQILALDINGCTDWALPSRDVLELAYRNLKPTAETNYVYRNGDNPSSLPAGYPYSEDLPAQTAAAAFREGGAEAMSDRWYWTSTQSSVAYAWLQYFYHGSQSYFGKCDEFLARAVRRFKA